MEGFPGFSPASFLLPFLLLQVPTLCSAGFGFSVKASAEPVVVLLGEDAILPCQLYPAQSTAHMHIRWYRAQLSPAVLVFQDRQDLGGEQMLEYRGRAELLGASLGRGDATLQIRRARTSDHGQYRCRVEDGDVFQEATVELHVIGLGSVPHIYMMGPEEGGIRVLCSSGGWFPSPKVQWRDTAGVKLPSLPESQSQDGDGLFRVVASLVVKDSSVGNVTCSIQNLLSGQEKASAIFLPEPFFPRVSPWKVALAGTLPVIGILLSGLSYVGWKQHQAKKRAIKEKKKESQETDQMRSEKESVLKDQEKLEAELERRKKLYHEDWKKALIYPDWRKEYFKPALVSLNHEIFDQNNSDPKRKENCNEEIQGDGNLITLEKKDFKSGQYYWEVDKMDTDEWTLGIYEEHEEENGLSKEASKKFRVLVKRGCEYRALAYCSQNIALEESLLIKEHPQKIVIFLDYEDSNLSFYDVASGAHIFSFTQPSFSGSVNPYFKHKAIELSHLSNIK
ncbi:butyrophilin-like protein 1 isoform X1 [Otolemur garnettii]|uniref:butyrophilin-like protein 1 isoform X1 n=1 Tax=Otolemur garnettii TaxID=30611 RepID=UPI000C7E8E63|nr:butyrophilin-like protein 1 isoform X1 [Otolemur garnettii]